MIRHIVACDSRRGIAKHGVQPWKLPGDEAYFSRMTKSHGGVVLMGRKTREAIGKPLVDRQNFILTSRTEIIAGAVAVHNLGEFLQNSQADIWIIGGARVYETTLMEADELYITEIDADFDCDQFYPDYLQNFELMSKSPSHTENDSTYHFCVYRPKKHI